MFHASHHITPVPASENEVLFPSESFISLVKFFRIWLFQKFARHPTVSFYRQIEDEAVAIKDIAETICPLKIVIDRVALTSTGVLLGCWQVILSIKLVK